MNDTRTGGRLSQVHLRSMIDRAGGVMGLDTLIVFTADGCPHCAALVEDFRRRGVRFREVNLSREPHQMTTLRRHSWEHRLPVVVDHERVSIGYRGGSSSYAELGLE